MEPNQNAPSSSPLHYCTVRLDEKRAAVAAALRLLPGGGESAGNGADAGAPANDTVDATAAKAAT